METATFGDIKSVMTSASKREKEAVLLVSRMKDVVGAIIGFVCQEIKRGLTKSFVKTGSLERQQVALLLALISRIVFLVPRM